MPARSKKRAKKAKAARPTPPELGPASGPLPRGEVCMTHPARASGCSLSHARWPRRRAARGRGHGRQPLRVDRGDVPDQAQGCVHTKTASLCLPRSPARTRGRVSQSTRRWSLLLPPARPRPPKRRPQSAIRQRATSTRSTALMGVQNKAHERMGPLLCQGQAVLEGECWLPAKSHAPRPAPPHRTAGCRGHRPGHAGRLRRHLTHW
jgi:hypothetical protein